MNKRIEISPVKKRKLLVLDLDETLIHTSYEFLLNGIIELNYSIQDCND
jgi:hypothetical protein